MVALHAQPRSFFAELGFVARANSQFEAVAQALPLPATLARVRLWTFPRAEALPSKGLMQARPQLQALAWALLLPLQLEALAPKLLARPADLQWALSAFLQGKAQLR